MSLSGSCIATHTRSTSGQTAAPTAVRQGESARTTAAKERRLTHGETECSSSNRIGGMSYGPAIAVILSAEWRIQFTSFSMLRAASGTRRSSRS